MRRQPAPPGRVAPPSSSSASLSHRANDAYMAAFERGLAERGASVAPGTSARDEPSPARLSVATARRSDVPLPPTAPPLQPPAAGWRRGPRDPAGTLVRLSDRPLLCGDADAGSGLAVLGGADHGAYVLDGTTGARGPTLHGGRVSHTEWVTAAVCLPGGRVATAAMDGRIIVWGDARGRRTAPPPGRELTGHFGSVSALCALPLAAAPGAPPRLLSGGYDKTVRVWASDARPGGGDALGVLRGHGAPVLAVLPPLAPPAPPTAASGDRDGVVMLWDVAAGAAAATLRGHAGHVTALAWLPSGPAAGDDAGGDGSSSSGGASAAPPLLLTGGQDGRVRVWDARSQSCVANVPAHAGAHGAGAVGDIAVAAPAAGRAGTLVVTGGADGAVCVLDPRAGFARRARLDGHGGQFVYSLRVRGGLALSGDGAGALLCHDVDAGRTLWALGANAAAVRVILVAGADALLAAGDDGCAIVYDMAAVAAAAR